MDLEVDIARLREHLEVRFGLALTSGVNCIDGGKFAVVRPADLDPGNGFCIALARTPRQVEASFHAGHFAAGLLRRMSESDEEAKHSFQAVAKQATLDGAHVYVAVNGSVAEELPGAQEPWRKVEIEVANRLPHKVSEEALAAGALSSASTCMALSLCLLPTEEVEKLEDPVHGLPEGAVTKVLVNRYERSPVNRATCIGHYGSNCQACGFDFGNRYGALGEGYIEVHHVVPVSQLGAGYLVDAVRDLIPLCPNCHAMAHRRSPPLGIEELRMALSQDPRHIQM